MNEKDQKILEMLKAGKSYTDIIAELSVSPSRVTVVKKKYSNMLSSANDALLGNTTTLFPKKEEVVKVVVPEVVSRPEPPRQIPPPPPIKITKESEKIANPSQPPLLPSLGNIEPEYESSGIIEVKLSDIKSIGGKPFLNSGGSKPMTVPIELDIMKRYLNLNGKWVYKKVFSDLLDDLQRLIKNKMINKSSKYAKEIMHIQKELVKTLEKHYRTRSQIGFSLDAKDKFVVDAYNRESFK